MSALFQDIIRELQKRRTELTTELEKIDQMIAIAKGTHKADTVEPCQEDTPKSGTPWTRYIREIIIEDGLHVTRQDLEKELVRRGVGEATVADSYNTIVGILARLTKQGELVRDDTGILRPGPKASK